MVNALSSLEVDIKDDDGVKRQSEFEKSRRTFFGCHDLLSNCMWVSTAAT
jgi:hypothetical protein